jgi:predicted CoA-substrate-specific enzyme activase
MQSFAGIDIGSTSAKTVVMDGDRNILCRLLRPTGWSSVDTALAIQDQLDGEGIRMEECTVVATGYGRVSVPYADRCVTEITCHARGACHLFGMDRLTVVDIGGQDTKIISIDGGQVRDFIMNDKCSAGTGRFLEVMANTLSVRPEELCNLAARGSGTSISSLCTVFAESEVVSLIGRGEKRENIAFAVVDSIAKKVSAQASRILEKGVPVCLTGGLCGCDYLRQSLEKAMGEPVFSNQDGQYAGAIGAALTAEGMKK